jgi:peptide/nickel transport system ATP-binding protein
VEILRVEGLRTYYFTEGGTVKAVDNVSFSLGRGESMAIVGESGCGKSTLGASLMRLVPTPGRIVSGSVWLEGEELLGMPEDRFRREVRWRKISLIPQNAMNALSPVKRVGDQIADAIMNHEDVSKQEAMERAKELFSRLGIDPSRVTNYPHEFSGGMRQRVVIAMALALSPSILIADEPTTALDVVVQAQILNLLKRLKAEMGLHILLITHDLSLVAELADRVLIMYAGKAAELGSADVIYRAPAHPYSQGLIRSIPRIGGKKEFVWIPGYPPDLISPPTGCRFHPRCPYAWDLCRREEPPLFGSAGGSSASCWLLDTRRRQA